MQFVRGNTWVVEVLERLADAWVMHVHIHHLARADASAGMQRRQIKCHALFPRRRIGEILDFKIVRHFALSLGATARAAREKQNEICASVHFGDRKRWEHQSQYTQAHAVGLS